MDKCIACGICTEKCPSKVDDEQNEGLNKRKAIYVKYSQAVPLKYAIDKESCRFLGKGKKCKICEKKCPSDAINFEDKEENISLNVGSIVLSTGFDAYNPSSIENYAYGLSKNVITSLELERILAASGPFTGHLIRPSDHKEPKRIAWLQCVGSRDINRCGNAYCSSVCCMYAIKEAAIAMDHSNDSLECSIFYMDMRTHGKDFDKYMEKAKDSGVRFVRSRIHTIDPVPETDNLMLVYADENGEKQTEEFDLVVLSVGLTTSPETIELANKIGIEIDKDKFCLNSTFDPVATSKSGVYVCGVFNGPKDIPVSVVEASAAACAASGSLAEVRNLLIKEPEVKEERNINGEPLSVGVFVCSCGTNIAGIVNVNEVADYARTLPHVTYVDNSLFSCSQDTQDKMKEIINEHGLNRVVVAACTPRTHEPLFQETIASAGLNKYLFEMANIRNHNSWVHSDTPEKATEKAKDLVRMAVAKVSLLQPLTQMNLGINKKTLVVGGGIAGLTAVKNLSLQGFESVLIEKTNRLGGQANNLFHTAKGEDIATYLNQLIKEVEDDKRIDVKLNTTISYVDGFVGNFKTTLDTNGKEDILEHGIAIIAVGASESKPTEYNYGQHPMVKTHMELDTLFKEDSSKLKDVKEVAFIQCVGSRETQRPYCSKVCCTHSAHSAVEIKKKNPDANVYIFYRDMRTYAQKEDVYKEARELGVIFIRYDKDKKPVVTADGDKIKIEFTDHVLGRKFQLNADLLVLAAAIESSREEKIARFFKIPLDDDGWFLEAHQKLRPVDFATDGLFLCGLAHYPKPIEESIAQAQAAVARAMTILSTDTIVVGGNISAIDKNRCSGCGVCITLCPYQAIDFDKDQKAVVNEALCKGCGICVSSCRSGAPSLKGFTNKEIMAQLDALEDVV